MPQQLNGWLYRYNIVHPYKALGYRSPREFRSSVKHGAAVDHH